MRVPRTLRLWLGRDLPPHPGVVLMQGAHLRVRVVTCRGDKIVEAQNLPKKTISPKEKAY